MKKLFLLALVFLSQISLGQVSGFFKSLKVSSTLVEIGFESAIREPKLKSLPYGVAEYVYYTKGSLNITLPTIEVYYKNFGLEIVFVSMSGVNTNADMFNRYLEATYPDYYVRGGTSDGTFGYFPGLRFCYQKEFKKYVLKPKFQMGYNAVRYYDVDMNFAKKDNNHFLNYQIRKVNLKKNIFDYHFILDFTKKIYEDNSRNGGWELGVISEFSIIPTTHNYIVKETFYGNSTKTNEVLVKRLNPSWRLALVARFKFN